MIKEKILQIKNLTIQVEERVILENVSLDIYKGEVHALIGPNGHGKTTLLLTLMNHLDYKITNGSIWFKNQNTKNLATDEIARLGMFLGFQAPPAIPGLKTIDFLKTVVNSHQEKRTSFIQFYKNVNKHLKQLALNKDILQREVNVNFSGGEKKKHEILQMLMLNNSLVLLDEIDSGLDVDNINEIISIINHHYKTTNTSYLVVSHYEKMFMTMKIDYTHLVFNKTLITTKGNKLIKKVHLHGYKKTIEDLGLQFVVEDESSKEKTILEDCAFKNSNG